MIMAPSDVEFHIELDDNTPGAIGAQRRGVMMIFEVHWTNNFQTWKIATIGIKSDQTGTRLCQNVKQGPAHSFTPTPVPEKLWKS